MPLAIIEEVDVRITIVVGFEGRLRSLPHCDQVSDILTGIDVFRASQRIFEPARELGIVIDELAARQIKSHGLFPFR